MIKVAPNILPKLFAEINLFVPFLNLWLNNEYKDKHNKELIMSVKTKITNCGKSGSETTINCGKSADVNIIALGLVKETKRPCEYKLQALYFTWL